MITAVEFLWNKLEEIRVDLITKSISNEESAKQRAEAFEQAKEMEKQQQGYSEEEVLNFTQTIIQQYKLGNTNIEQLDLLKETLELFKKNKI